MPFQYVARLAIFGTVLLASQIPAQEPVDCRARASNPSPTSPTVSDATDTASCGVLVVESSWERQWPGDAARDDSLGALFRFGIRPNLELRWASDGAMFAEDGQGSASGIGDTYVGVKYRIREQSPHFPSLALRYTLKIPTASPEKGLGSGFADHEIGVLLSRDFRPLHLDFTALQDFSGTEPGNGFEHTTWLALSATRNLGRRASVYGESYGVLPLENDNVAGAGAIAGLSYRLNSRLVVFSAVDFALTDNLPRKRLLVSLSYAVGNLYSFFKPSAAQLARKSTIPAVSPESGHNSVQ